MAKRKLATLKGDGFQLDIYDPELAERVIRMLLNPGGRSGAEPPEPAPVEVWPAPPLLGGELVPEWARRNPWLEVIAKRGA